MQIGAFNRFRPFFEHKVPLEKTKFQKKPVWNVSWYKLDFTNSIVQKVCPVFTFSQNPKAISIDCSDFQPSPSTQCPEGRRVVSWGRPVAAVAAAAAAATVRTSTPATFLRRVCNLPSVPRVYLRFPSVWGRRCGADSDDAGGYRWMRRTDRNVISAGLQG